MKIPKSQVKRLSHVVPGYVWRQGALAFEATDSCEQLIRLRSGVVFVGSPSQSRREYALAWCLSRALTHDYYADIGWLSWFAKTQNEFTGAVCLPKIHEVMAVSIKEEVTDAQLDQLRDILTAARLGFVASPLAPIRLANKLHLPSFAEMRISANDARLELI